MRHRMWLLLGIVAFSWLPPALADDGTLEGPAPDSGNPGDVGDVVYLGSDRYLVTPTQSVSISLDNVWRDNRHRAYYGEGTGHVNGFLLFDIAGIPDDECIVRMTLRCYLENAYGSPYSSPVVDVYYSADDGWTRYSVGPGALSLDALLVDDVPFTTYVPYHDFVLDVGAHDWSIDQADNQICIGFTNDVSYYSYVYFFGAYGDPTGPPPELTIETGGPSPADDGTWGEIKALFR